jgi:hypothetical protein
MIGHEHIIMKIWKMDKNDYFSYFFKVIPMVCLERTFLQGHYANMEELYIEVLDGFQEC